MSDPERERQIAFSWGERGTFKSPRYDSQRKDVDYLLTALDESQERERELREALSWFTKSHDPRCSIHHGSDIEGRVVCDCGMLKARELLAAPEQPREQP